MKFLGTLAITVVLSYSSFAQTADSVSIRTRYSNTRDTLGIVHDPDQKVKYTGGNKGWLEFVRRNIDMRSATWDLRQNNIKQETAIVQFVVCADGSVCEIQLTNDVQPSVKKEVLRLVKKSGKWLPAQKDGVAVKAHNKVPITFVNSNWQPEDE